jgi:2-oxoglutarate dehydrogenase E2 component (dihydrolipoamide succinyltransferase)
MAIVSIVIPGVGESITEGILAKWLKPNGSAVKAGEPLFELETDKASNVIPAPAAGTLKIGVEEGATVAIGSTIGSLDPSGVMQAAVAVETKPLGVVSVSGNGGTSASAELSPATRRIVEESKVDASKIEGTGRDGRLTKGDVITHLEAPVSSTPVQAPASAPSISRPRETRQRMTGIRQKIAQRLVEAQHTAAILTTFNEADMSRVMDLRSKYKEAFQKKHGVGLGFMSFFVKATIEALRAFPAVNGRVEGQDIILNNVYDIGVAVSTERGLMVPVIRDADALSFAGIEKAIGEFAKKSRDNAISVADLQGGTFTITNGGVFGSLLSTPILNPPQSGILGMHSIQKRPVAIDDQVVIRPMMYLALSYDHRIVDGKGAVSFLVKIKECIENPERMLIDI